MLDFSIDGGSPVRPRTAIDLITNTVPQASSISGIGEVQQATIRGRKYCYIETQRK